MALKIKRISHLPRWKLIVVWTLQITVFIVFLITGISKIVGTENMMTLFIKIGLGEWFRYLTGSLEVIGALLILFPRSAFWGGFMLASLTIGEFFTHLLITGDSVIPTFILFMIAATITSIKQVD